MSYTSDNDDSFNPWYSGPRAKEDTTEKDLRTENARLKAELEALRPKPAISERFYFAERDKMSYWTDHACGLDNLKLTFEDDVLVSAEVINK